MMRQQLFDSTGRLCRQPLQHIAQACVGVVAVQARRMRRTHHRRSTLAGAQRFGEQPGQAQSQQGNSNKEGPIRLKEGQVANLGTTKAQQNQHQWAEATGRCEKGCNPSGKQGDEATLRQGLISWLKITSVLKYGVKRMEKIVSQLTIGEFAASAGVNVETIRFYQRKGLLAEPERPYGSIRRYGAAEVSRVRFVKSAQRLVFSLDDISELLRLEDGTHCQEARGLAERKLVDVREKLNDLHRMESVLSTLVEGCRSARGSVSCPLISALHDA